jgi:hypothetical protein
MFRHSSFMKRNDKPTSPPSDMITAADLLAGAVMPMKLTLNVTIRPGVRDETAPDDPECQHRQSPTVESRLSKYTPHVAKWAAESNENAALLLVDPMQAIARSGAEFSRADQLLLKRHVRSVGPTEVLPPGVELVAANIKFGGEQPSAASPATKAGRKK